MQYKRTITTIHCRISNCIIARGRIGLTMPCIGLTIANNNTLLGHWYLRKNGQMEQHYTVTTMYILHCNRIIARGRIGFALPCIALTVANNGTLLGYWHLWKNGQMEHHYAITAMDGLQRGGIVTRNGISLTMPCISLTVANSCTLLSRWHLWKNGQMKHHHAIATICI